MEAVPEPADGPQANLLKGRYRTLSKISQGTYGKVYIAFDYVAKENVALKKIIFHV